MEKNLTHSRNHPNRSTLPKKPHNGTNGGYTSVKTSNTAATTYDDVFGGPPRFAPSLSPRLEDYCEIFSAFNSSSSRAAAAVSSIPVLDLPLDKGVYFDVRRESLDYREVFGGLDDLDFAPSYEELFTQQPRRSSTVADAYSSDDAWTPEEVEKSPSFSNGRDSYDSIDGCTEFNVSYHKASGDTSIISSGVTRVAPPDLGYTLAVDEMVGGAETGPSSSVVAAFEDKYHPSEPFVTVSEIGLKTNPTGIPPPSRPPPVLKSGFRRSGSGSRTTGSEGSEGGGSPPFFDVEVDAVRDAMVKAEAKLKSAKEMFERKQTSMNNRIMSQEGNNIDVTRKPLRDEHRSKSLSSQGSVNSDGNEEWEEATQFVELVRTEQPRNADENSAGEDVSCPLSATGFFDHESKKLPKHFGTRKVASRHKRHEERLAEKAPEEPKNEKLQFEVGNNNLLSDHGGIVKHRNLLRPEEKTKRLLNQQSARRPERKAVEKNQDHVFDWEQNARRLREALGLSDNESTLEVSVGRGGEREESETKLKEALRRMEEETSSREVSVKEESERKEKEALEKAENEKRRLRAALEEEEKVKKLKEEDERRAAEVEEERRRKEQEENERRLKEAFEKEEENRRMREALDEAEKERRRKEQEEYERKLKEAFEKEEKNRRMREAREKAENERIRIKEAHEKAEVERRKKEALEQEEKERQIKELQERRAKEALEQAENERKLKEAHEKEESERKLKEAIELEEKEKRLIEAFERAETERRLKEEELEQEEEMRLQEAKEREERETTLRENQERMEKTCESETTNETNEEENLSDTVEEEEGPSQRVSVSEEACPWKVFEKNLKDASLKEDTNELDAESVKKLNGEESGEESSSPDNVQGGKLNHKSRTVEESNQERPLPSQVFMQREKEAERLKRELDSKMEHLRKIEEEREREREREKDRMAFDQRALADARERLEKACAEARERSFPSTESKLRAERAAVERATAEARERAAEKAAFEARDRMERSVSDKQFHSSGSFGERTTEKQFQNSASFGASRYQNSPGGAGAGAEGESPQRYTSRLERHRRTADRVAKALAEKNMRDLVAQREQAERTRIGETLDAEVKRWSSGKEGNIRALLSTLQYILGSESGWQPVPLTEVITSAAVKRAYRKATLCVHPDKLQQRGANIHQKYICEKVFDLLKEAWNRFNSEER